MAAFHPSRRDPEICKWRHLARDVRGAVETGVLRAGDRIPTEGQLCAVYGYSRATVRRARAYLEQQGLIEVRPYGAFVPRDRLSPT